MSNVLWGSEVDFGFGFDDIDFSDRVLRLEIVPVLDSNSNSGGEIDVNSLGEANGSEFVKESKLITVHISRILLAAKSPFSYKLFKNGMRESQKKDDVTLKIHASEEAAFVDMLKYIYDKPLNATSRAELVDVLVVADKFEVTACMMHCVELFLKLAMTVESAVRPLIDAANQHLSSRFSAFSESQQEELMRLPLCAVEAVLLSPDLQVNSEDAVLDFILKWESVVEIVDYPDFDYKQVSRLVLEALSYKIELLKGSNSAPIVRTLLPNKALVNCAFSSRVYYHRRVIHLDIKKQDCADIHSQSSRICSEPFCIGGQSFSLCASNSTDQFLLCLYLQMKASASGSCSLDNEFAVMKNPSKEFQTEFTTDYTFDDLDNRIGKRMFLWTTDLFSDNSAYFIDGILHLRAQLSIVN